MVERMREIHTVVVEEGGERREERGERREEGEGREKREGDGISLSPW